MTEWSRLTLYNEVVAYHNQCSTTLLQPVPTAHEAFASPRSVWICFLLLTLVPVVNFLLLVVLAATLVALLREITIVVANRRKVANPFEPMLADRELAQPCLMRIGQQGRRISEHCTLVSESVLHRGSQVTYYRPDIRENYERMAVSAVKRWKLTIF